MHKVCSMDLTHTYMPIGEVAEALGVTVATVRNWDSSGKLRAIRTPGNQRRFRASDVEAILARSADWSPAS